MRSLLVGATCVVCACSSMDFPVDAIAEAIIYGVVSDGSEAVAGASVEGVVFRTSCSQGVWSAPLTTQTDEEGRYRLHFADLMSGPFQACVRVTAVDSASPATSVQTREGVHFAISAPFDSVRMDLDLQ